MDYWTEARGVGFKSITYPQEFMDDAVTREIAEGVGKIIKKRSDNGGERKKRYARYKVEVDIDKEVPDGAFVALEEGESEPFWNDFKYERLPTLCDVCKVISHRTSTCPKKVSLMLVEKEDNEIKMGDSATLIAGYGVGRVALVASSGKEGEGSLPINVETRDTNSSKSCAWDIGETVADEGRGGTQKSGTEAMVTLEEEEWTEEDDCRYSKVSKRQGKELITEMAEQNGREVVWAGVGLIWKGLKTGP